MLMDSKRIAEARARCEGRVPWTVDPDVEDFCVAYEDGFCDRDVVVTACDRATCDLAIQHQPYGFRGPRWVEYGDGESVALAKRDAEDIVADHNELADLLDDLEAAMAVVRAAEGVWEDYDGEETWAIPEDMRALRAALAALGEVE